MEAYELVRLLVNKMVVPPTPRRPGNPGYGRLRAVRLLVYSRLVGLENDTRVAAHLARHRYAAGALGFKHIPDRTTAGRWWRRYACILAEVFNRLSAMVQVLMPTRLLAVDPTPLIGLQTLRLAEWGFTSKGAFRGFKLHASVDQHGPPLKARVTPGSRHDSPRLPSLVQDLEAECVVADAGCDSRANREAVRATGATPVTAMNEPQTRQGEAEAEA